jgi:hypothetical protein
VQISIHERNGIGINQSETCVRLGRTNDLCTMAGWSAGYSIAQRSRGVKRAWRRSADAT